MKIQEICPDFSKKSTEKGVIDQILENFEKLASDNFPTVLTLPAGYSSSLWYCSLKPQPPTKRFEQICPILNFINIELVVRSSTK